MNTPHHVRTTQANDNVQFPSAWARVPSPEETATYMERVDEYEQDGVRQADPDAAFSAVIVAELMRIAFALENLVQEAFALLPSTVEGRRAVEPMVVRYLRAVGRIERNVRLEICCKNVGGQRVTPRARST
jgi:hypothetical protein